MLAQLMAEIFEVLLGQTAFEKGACVNTRRGVALEVDEVAGLIAIRSVEEMIEPNLEQGGQRGVGGDVAANPRVLLILPMDHRHGVPADEALDAPLQPAITGVGELLIDRNRVEVG